MGCTTSRPLVDTSGDGVRKCKDRRLLIHNAMKHRQDFAIAHMAYIQSLRNVGFALRRFAEGEISDVESSPRTPNTPVLALPQPLSPRVGALSPSLPSSSPASTFSPPPSSPSNLNLNPNQPSTPPLAIPVSPPLSPIRLSSDPSPFSPSSPRLYLYDAAPLTDNMDTASPDRGSELSSPYYSPTRDDLDNALVAYSPPPPSSLLTDSSWFSFDIFTPPLIPSHLQEHRRMKRVGDMEDEDILAYNKVQEDEGMPDLEEVEPKEDEAGQDDRDKIEEAVSEKNDKGVVSEEKVGPFNTKINEDGSVSDNMEKDQVVVVSAVQKEVVVAENDGKENDGKEKAKKEVGVASTLKERNLTEAVRHIDDQFTRACKSGEDVSRMLETQMHYHSRISGLKDSSKVFNAITSHWSRKTSSATRDAYEDNDASECGMAGSHASTLERLYAWEKKLYDEVKAGEFIRMAFDQKCKQLHNLDAKGGDSIVLDTMRASLKKLDMRLMVAMRAIHVTSSRIQVLTNEELYPQLYELLGGLVSMWKMMLECHQAQQAITLEMQTLENSVAGDEASEAHKKATIELGHELEKWQSHFQRWIWSQKKYINDLHKWLEGCYETRESSMSGKKVSSEWTERAPIFCLLKGWMESLVGLETQQKVINSIRSFAAVICSLEENQSAELKLKKQVERSSKLLDQQTLSLKKLEKKHVEGRANTTNGKLGTSGLTTENKLQEKRVRLNQHRTLVENEKHKHSAAVQVRRNTTLDRLKQHLPTVFESMASFAEDAQKMYEKIQEKTKVAEDAQKMYEKIQEKTEVVGESPDRENGAAHQILE